MYDTYYSFSDTTTNRATVYEYRTSTDDSIRLYHEIREEVKREILDSYIIKNTLYECSVVVSRDIAQNFIQFYYRLMINGNQIDGNCKINRDEFTKEKADLIIAQKFTESLFAKIADELVKPENCNSLRGVF